ncbi:HAD family hydrolase [Aquimarina sp. ERC-38]|uniref:HAD family hydrolase n=1 Tax=Aquimarina sp. ERC-38 TaxID=2949996 RepID=UPI002247E203|nr:HAD family hydrolase [Aquimarina sp. ERC-38]UZO82365.1 HAD family hydrolase [Aquimarina sp. ERC-38]
MDKKNVIFDLDDTLSKEILYLESAYKTIADFIATKLSIDAVEVHQKMLRWYHTKENAFEKVVTAYSSDTVQLYKNELLDIYRNHLPNITLKEEVIAVLDYCKNKEYNLGLLTDGRSVQQRNKIKALGLSTYFKEIVISEEFGSEKPNPNNYRYFESVFGEGTYYYIGDNTSKDFLSPNQLNWISICLKDNGENIHSQNFNLPKEYVPKHTIHTLKELLPLL